MSFYGFPEYVSVAEKKQRAAEAFAKLKKKRPDAKGVLIKGRNLAETWWGKSWNQNLERYADYSNRIDRGRAYVRSGAVLDLKIKSGVIHADVMGSSPTPYKVLIQVKPLNKNTWKVLQGRCHGDLSSIQELLNGEFPEKLKGIFFNQKGGLFPSPKEIDFDCSCPDWASMCKHVASALYGIGVRLDQSPEMFFALRQVNMEELVRKTLKAHGSEVLKKVSSGTKSSRILRESASELGDLFGIDLNEDTPKSKSSLKKPQSLGSVDKRKKSATQKSSKKEKPPSLTQLLSFLQKNKTSLKIKQKRIAETKARIQELKALIRKKTSGGPKEQ